MNGGSSSKETKKLVGVCGIRLSPSDTFTETNSSCLMKASIVNDDNRFLLACELSRKAVEASGIWMLKIIRRYGGATRESAVIINYGAGYASMVLVDGVQLPTNPQIVPRIGVNISVASIASEKSPHTRPAEFGFVTPEDSIKYHMTEALDACPEGVMIYLHPSGTDSGLDGVWGNDSRKRVFRLWSRPENPFALYQMERGTFEEQYYESRYKEEATRKMRLGSTIGEIMPSAPNEATETAPRTNGAGPPLHPPQQQLMHPPPQQPPQQQQFMQTNGNSTRVITVTRTIPFGGTIPGQMRPARRTIPSEVFSKNGNLLDDAVDLGSKKNPNDLPPQVLEADDTESKDGSKVVGKEKLVKDAKKAPLFSFAPREILLLCRAFEGKLLDEDKKFKTKNKGDKMNYYTGQDIKNAKKVYRAIAAEVAIKRATRKIATLKQKDSSVSSGKKTSSPKKTPSAKIMSQKSSNSNNEAKSNKQDDDSASAEHGETESVSTATMDSGTRDKKRKRGDMRPSGEKNKRGRPPKTPANLQ